VREAERRKARNRDRTSGCGAPSVFSPLKRIRRGLASRRSTAVLALAN
jgi:hypothetical protein